MPPLGEALRAIPAAALRKTYFDGPLSFVVGLDGGEGQFRVHMHLSGLTWRLAGLDVPEAVSARLAREIAARVGGAAEGRGG